ncbi:EF hand family protein [Trichomonas vaginalis G3]|uniref:EF hand family protein n=1 Tax=Trichomonas vaginalis (strain ATCC PRA-98 / G3) TaxID=412133 RepID=A2DW31_TRIV3|nr:EF-Hand calcium-binding domain-containing protein 6-related family [Trichomonas vaginalis G3]EAY15332.1 EF hand family protein [Trichomonas vaginalis G3]KAI5496805.1 EF-Hand calcium-binding domain-containing protein 6-related family [Trichomonas vaginalis G3]|eukprot:XP_001327555.1 EF hand family protein [Trichomonas vaginalis G3]
MTSYLINELRKAIKTQGLNAEELFTEYDRKETGLLSMHHFRKVFADLEIWTDEKVFRREIAEYRNDDGFIEYRSFLAALNEQNQTLASTRKPDDVLFKFGSDLEERGLSICDCLAPYDRFHRGTVSAATFLAVIMTPLAPEIAKRYAVPPDNLIHFYDLNKEIQEILKNKPQTQTKVVTMETVQLPDKTLNKIPKLSVQIKQYGIDPLATFKQYDLEKTNLITKGAFMRGLSALSPNIAPDEIKEIASAFSNANGLVNYTEFCDIVNQQQEISEKKIENETREYTLSILPKPVDPEVAFKKLYYIIQDRHAQLIGHCQNFDPNETGKIDRQTFLQILKAEGYPLNDLEKEAIVSKYIDDKNKINYEKLSSDIDMQSPNDLVEKTETLVVMLKDHLLRKQLNITSICNKLDQSHSGALTFNQLLALLRIIQFDVNVKEQSLLRMRFATNKDGTIPIEDLCKELNPPEPETTENEKKEEEEPVKKRIERTEPTDEEKEALARIAAISNRQSVDIRGECKVYDGKLFGTIQESKFRNVLIRIGNISDQDIDLFAHRYVGRIPTEINYADFANDVDKYGTEFLSTKPEITTKVFAESPEPSEETIAAMKAFRVFLSKRGAEPMEHFVPYDHRKTGHVRCDRAEQIIISTRPPLTRDQIKSIIDAYALPNCSEIFDYTRMCNVCMAKEVKSEELATFKLEKPSMDHRCADALSIVRDKIYSRRRRPLDLFKDVKEPAIPASDFRMRFSEFGINLREPDLQTIMKYFRANMRGDVDWMDFCNKVENLKFQ